MILIQNKNDLRKLKDEMKSLEKHLNIALSIMRGLEEAERKSFEELPGKIGVFDGEFMVAESGEKFPVPANYAAKSLLLFGDKMKMVEEDGKPFFKNISKVTPKEIRGVLSKKEDVWYILADCGSYRISDTAVSFHEAKQNVKAVALIPEDNVKAPFAALKRVENVGEENKPGVSTMPVVKKPLMTRVAPEINPAAKKPEAVEDFGKRPEKVPEKKIVVEKSKEPVQKPVQKKELPKTAAPAPATLEEDDLR